MKRAVLILTFAAALAVTGLATSAFSEDSGLSELKRDLAKLAEGQRTILKELQAIREELNIVKIRCSL